LVTFVFAESIEHRLKFRVYWFVLQVNGIFHPHTQGCFLNEEYEGGGGGAKLEEKNELNINQV